MRVAPVGITAMGNIVCLIVVMLNLFIQRLEVAVQVDGTVIAIGVWRIVKTLNKLWLKKEAVAQVVGIRIVVIV